jgi:hypothetical protein
MAPPGPVRDRRGSGRAGLPDNTLGLLGNLQHIVDLDAKIPDRAPEFGAA